MRIKICGKSGHLVYDKLKENAEYGFTALGHDVVEGDADMIVTFGTSVTWDEIKDLPGKKFLLCHGVQWSKPFDSYTDNNKIKQLFDNCDGVAYSSEFAKHMAFKYLGKREGPFVYNCTVPDLLNIPMTWSEGEPIKIVTCSIPRAWKRIYEMERLIEKFNREGMNIEFHLIGGYPTPEIGHMHTGAEEPTSDNSFYHSYGQLPWGEVKKIFQQCHFSLHFGLNDYSPATVGESMAWGIPVIVTNSGGSKDIVKNTGIVIESDPLIDYPHTIEREDLMPKVDEKQFRDAINEMIHNLSYYQQKTKDAVIDRFNCVDQTAKFLEMYTDEKSYIGYQESRGMTASATSQEVTPWIKRFIEAYPQYLEGPILDIGCGDGGFVGQMNQEGKFAIGVDISKSSGGKGLGNNIPIVLCDAQKEIPFPDKIFKTVTSFHSFEHFIFPIRAINNIKKVLSGNFCIIVPKQVGDDELHGHYTYFNNMNKLTDFLINQGFEILVADDWNNMLCVVAKHE